MELDPEQYIHVSEKDLSPESFRGVVENFVLQEGTDYGLIEFTLEEKVNKVIEQIRDKKAALVFDKETETCTVILKDF